MIKKMNYKKYKNKAVAPKREYYNDALDDIFGAPFDG